MHLLQRVAACANEAATAEEALALAVAHVCKTLGWPAGHVYQPILDGGGLVRAVPRVTHRGSRGDVQGRLDEVDRDPDVVHSW